MKNFILIIVSLSFLSSRSNDKDFFLTEGNALLSCGGKSRIIENDKEEIINIEVKDLRDGIGKYVEFTVNTLNLQLLRLIKKEANIGLLIVSQVKNHKIQ